MYKYTYQDWQEETINPKDLYSLKTKGELNPDDYRRIKEEQEFIAKERIEAELVGNIDFFISIYTQTFVKEAFLDNYIASVQEELDNVKLRYPNIYREVLWGIDGRDEYTYNDLAYYNYIITKEADEIPEEDDYSEIRRMLKRTLKEGLHHIHSIHFEIDQREVIIALKFLHWLKWFKEQDAQINSVVNEKFYRMALKEGDKVKSHAKVKYITWPELFIEPKQAEKILELIKEHLSSSGEWITYPKSRYLVALCLELENKGYFLSSNTISNPIKAIAFRIQFGNISTKNFQPEERNKAEDFREYFKHIPPYKAEIKA